MLQYVIVVRVVLMIRALVVIGFISSKWIVMEQRA